MHPLHSLRIRQQSRSACFRTRKLCSFRRRHSADLATATRPQPGLHPPSCQSGPCPLVPTLYHRVSKLIYHHSGLEIPLLDWVYLRCCCLPVASTPLPPPPRLSEGEFEFGLGPHAWTSCTSPTSALEDSYRCTGGCATACLQRRPREKTPRLPLAQPALPDTTVLCPSASFAQLVWSQRSSSTPRL